jgi:signal transduction histidine kinase
VILAGIVFATYRTYRRAYLAVLGWSWLALCVYQLNGAASVAFGPPDSHARTALSIAGHFAGYVQIGWLVLGVHGLTTGRPITRRAFFAVAGLCGVVALTGWGLTVNAPSEARFFVRVSLRALLAALAFLLAASQVLARRRHGLGRWLVAGGFALYALDLLQYFGVGLPGSSPTHTLHLGYVDILAQMLTGLGLVISMLEDERERAAAAAEALQDTHHHRLHSSKMEALGRMAGGVSHDFNNLLTAMRGHLELALERTPYSDPRRVDLEQAWRAAERACHLTQQLLSFSRSRSVGASTTCDLVGSLQDLRPLLVQLVGTAIDVDLDLPSGPLFANIDRVGLEQVIFNLGANARDAMPAGGKLRLRVRQPGSNGMVELKVTDTGTGMDDATRARMFDPFFTTKPPGFGTGLGLAQVYGIVQQARGQIECTTAPGRGTTFTITLPTATSPADATAPTPAPGAILGLGQHRDRVVMLVDDDELVRELLCRSLREHGYTVIEASDPIEALALDAEFDEPIDLLVTDLAMPKLSGTELAARMCERRPQMRLLFISGFAASHTPNPDIELLQKPFAQTTFLERVEKILTRLAV